MKKEHCVKLIKQIEESDIKFESVDFPHKKHYKTDINTPMFSWFIDIIKKEVKELNKNYIPTDWITLLLYKKGDFFNKHTDASSYPGYLSAGYLLNEDFSGGEFVIENEKLSSNIGDLFTFGRDDNHYVTPVTEGIRYSIHFSILLDKKSVI